MPLYDFLCHACDQTATLLLKAGEPGTCPRCGSGDLEKLVAPFAFKTAGGLGATASGGPEPTVAAPKKDSPHVCTGGCQHGTAEKLIKKYLD